MYKRKDNLNKSFKYIGKIINKHLKNTKNVSTVQHTAHFSHLYNC